MTTLYAYPRLPDGEALVRLARVRAVAGERPAELSEVVEFEHPAATPVPTGALIADRARVEGFRHDVLELLDGWLEGEPIPRRSTADFDRALGAALHQEARLLPADAAHQGTWNFLSAMVFPDVVWARFPDVPEERFLGRPRNALRRVWYRQEVLGELMAVSGPSGLGEDELVGLLERTSLARNRRLVRAAAATVLKYSGSQPRSEWARDFYKRLTHQTGPLLLDVLDDDELTDMIQAVAAGEPWAPRRSAARSIRKAGVTRDGRHSSEGGKDVAAEDDSAARGSSADVAKVTTFSALPSAKDSGDRVKAFHRAMLDLVATIRREVDYNPAALLRMVLQSGGTETARRIAGTPDLSEGFTVLWERGRLDLTVESLVLDSEYSGLFSGELLDVARAKLADAGWPE